MRRNLLVAAGLVKQASEWLLGLAALAASLGGACAGTSPPPRRPDPYGPRIADCIDQPRPLADAAQARMRVVPTGDALLGSTARERAQARLDYGRDAPPRLFEDEPDARGVRLPGFRLDPSPVTGELYAEFTAACGVLAPDRETMTAERWAAQRERFGLRYDYAQVEPFLWPGAAPDAARRNHPVVLVGQDDAGFYCAWRGGRLPSEQEWERAARGPAGHVYPWGQRYDPARANSAPRGLGDTLAVGKLPPGNTAEGFTDMGGNVFEWTATPWPGKSGQVVVKGNGWDGRGGFGRGAARVALPAALRHVTVGFRCAADL